MGSLSTSNPNSKKIDTKNRKSSIIPPKLTHLKDLTKPSSSFLEVESSLSSPALSSLNSLNKANKPELTDYPNYFYPCFNKGYINIARNITGKGNYDGCYSLLLDFININKTTNSEGVGSNKLKKELKLHRLDNIDLLNSNIKLNHFYEKYKNMFGFVENNMTIVETNRKIKDICDLDYSSIVEKFNQYKSL